MQARVAGNIGFELRRCPPKLVQRLRLDLSFPNPEHKKKRMMGWDPGSTPETIECLVETEDGRVEIPRGAVGILRKRSEEVGVELGFDDARQVPGRIELKANVQLRPYQEAAVRAMARGVQGTVVMPPGAGKTVTGTAAIARIGQPTLVIVHTHDLAEQWRQSIEKFLGIEAGQIGDGKRYLTQVTVATVQSLVRMHAKDLEDLGRRFGCVIVDEAHHAPAVTFRMVLSSLPARYRFGLTATPDRDDGLSALVDLTFGERLFEIGYPELVAKGYLQAPVVKPIFSSFDYAYYGPKNLHACMSALIECRSRNNTIAELAASEAKKGHSVLVLSGRVAHCKHLAKMIGYLGVSAEVLVGSVKKAQRKKILDRFREGEIRVVIASTLADEGLDVPRMDRVILAYPGRASGRTAQRLGRLMRPHPEKQGAVLYDIVDAAVAPLMRQYSARNRLYKRLAAGIRDMERNGYDD